MIRSRTPVALAVLAGVTLAGCGPPVPVAAPAPEPSGQCDRADRALLDRAPVLATTPPGAKQIDRYQECDGLDAYAGRFYETGLAADRVVAFYRGELGGHAWQVRSSDTTADPGDDLFCATTRVGGARAYLELWYPDQDSGLLDGRPAGTVYALDLSRSLRVASSC